QMRTHWARKGRPATLNCTLKAPPDNTNFSLEWRKDGQLVHSAYGSEPGHSSPGLQGRIARSEGLGLTIHAVQREDEAVYTCSVTRFFSSSPTAPIVAPPVRLVVNVPPTISEPVHGEVFFAEEGKPLEIKCSSSAVPPPEVSWIKNGKIVSGSNVLSIPSVSVGHQGSYSCLSANSEGRVEAVIELRFPKRVHFDYPPQNKTVVAGSSSFWNCHATGYPDRINYEWKFEGKPVKTTAVGLRAHTGNGELAIRDVKKEDRGMYTCHARNIFGESVTAAFLDVQYLPEILSTNVEVYTLAVGSNATLTCASDANPAVTMVNWTRNGHFVATKETDSFDLINVSAEDSGLYACEVFNSLGRGTPFEMHVIVAQPPAFIVKPPPEIRVKVGERLDVRCAGFADPTPIQYWIRNQERTASEYFIIERVAYEDDGVYECVVSNAVATVKTETRVRVENTQPQPPRINQVSCDGERGLKIAWSEGFDGGHPQRFIIYAEEISEEGPSGMQRRAETDQKEVDMDNLSPFGKYRITIEAVNRLGSANSTSLDRHVCTRLSSPEDPRLDRDRLVWQPIEGARSYRVEMKNGGGHYAQVAEVLHPHFSISSITRSANDIDLRIIGLRQPFPPSAPSRPVTIAMRETSQDGQLALALCGGLLLFVFLAMILFIARRNSSKMRRKEKHATNSPTFHSYGCTVHTPQVVRQMYDSHPVPLPNIYDHDSESFTTALIDGEINFLLVLVIQIKTLFFRVDEDIGEAWSEHSRDHVVRGLEAPSLRDSTTPSLSRSRSIVQYDHEALSIERESVVGDMLRSKYFVSADDAHSALIDELRLARLRKEFHQSHL
ncbi:hypothetical protein PENTCL1PPCAC_28641, partial [Pristionchus entomophagus]